MISFVVITIEGAFADSQSTANSRGVTHIFSRCGEVFVNAVHHGNDGADIWGIARKEKGAVLEDLRKRLNGNLIRGEKFTYLQSITDLLCNCPLRGIQFKTSHLHIAVASDHIDCWLVIDGEVDHVER